LSVLNHHFLSTPPAPTHTHTLSLHDALPISPVRRRPAALRGPGRDPVDRAERVGGVPAGHLEAHAKVDAQLRVALGGPARPVVRSEEHTSELQSRGHLVCRLLLEKKKYLNTE